MSEETAIAVVEDNQIGVAEDALSAPTHHAVAINAGQLQSANADVRKFLEAKVEEFDEEIAELKQSREIAIQRKWASHQWWGPIYRAEQRREYYAKLLGSVNAGYTIVPNMPTDWFAIRINRSTPGIAKQTMVAKQSYHDTPTVAMQDPDLLPVGQGQYESGIIESRETSKWVSVAGRKEELHKALALNNKFNPISFPFAAAHPIVMNATDHAMKQLIFDRIGIVPQSIEPKADPLILGQIQAGHDPGKFVSFIIGWYLDMRTL